ncbi:MAG: 3-phosphoshikimate 1-carboxyvinyltransferase, partial [Candidatus Omnitrophica bacterium]|nr:3-phosphoshikimate 1-carboxyvinyltransferase [Candidatus Omnitrophota bacterium]
PITSLEGIISVPADKSILHRAIIVSALCSQKTVITPFTKSNDILTTLKCVKKLGTKIITNEKGYLTIEGRGLYFSRPKNGKITISANESGTTMRILSGVLCAQKFSIKFLASPSLMKRPMKRIVEPLSEMGAKFRNKKVKAKIGKGKDIYPPLFIEPVKILRGKRFNLPIPSAQVKSAIILASLYAQGQTIIREPWQSRDHTERLLKFFKANIKIKGKNIISRPLKELFSPGRLYIPADFSSAAFFIVLGLITKESKITIKNVNINPTRCGLLKVLKRMGANINIINKESDYEPFGDIIVRSSRLKATTVSEEEIPSLIDEVPILGVAAAFAEGETKIYGVNELQIKETDRLNAMVINLRKAGVSIKLEFTTIGKKAVIKIVGNNQFNPAFFKSFDDHRTAMSAVILGAASSQYCSIDNIDCIDKSFPQFISLIESLQK